MHRIIVKPHPSYLPSDILAAFLYAQLEAREEIQAKRRQIWEYYYLHLATWAGENGVHLPVVPADCDQSYHMFYLILPSLEYRQALMEHLKSQGILRVFHSLPLHLSDMGRHFGGMEGDCPVTEDVSDCLLRLPFYNDFDEADQARAVATIKEFEMASFSSMPIPVSVSQGEE